MKDKISKLLRNQLRKLFSLFSITSVAFVMQACYGAPEDIGLSSPFRGQVLDKETHKPIRNIKVTTEFGSYVYSDDEGNAVIYVPNDELLDSMKITCEDIDSTENGQYQRLDTIIPYTEIDKTCKLYMKRL